MNTCPSCHERLTTNKSTLGDWTAFSCPNHGEFKLSGTLLAIIPHNSEGILPILAEYIENRETNESVICTTDLNI